MNFGAVCTLKFDENEVEMYRTEKEDRMRNGYLSHEQRYIMRDSHTQDMFGGLHGIDPDSHGVELQ
jgi:hypothetical protein